MQLKMKVDEWCLAWNKMTDSKTPDLLRWGHGHTKNEQNQDELFDDDHFKGQTKLKIEKYST